MRLGLIGNFVLGGGGVELWSGDFVSLSRGFLLLYGLYVGLLRRVSEECGWFSGFELAARGVVGCRHDLR